MQNQNIARNAIIFNFERPLHPINKKHEQWVTQVTDFNEQSMDG